MLVADHACHGGSKRLCVQEAAMSEAPYPPAEPPADGDRTSQVPPPGATPRYSASASVPVPPAQPQGPGAFGQPPTSFGQGNQYGQPAFGQGTPNPGQQPTAQPGQAQVSPPGGTQYG